MNADEQDQGPAASCQICVGAGIVEDYDGERACVCQMPAADKSPTNLDALARAMMGTEDGGMLDVNEEIPIGECYRLAAEWFTDGQYKSPSEVAELVNAAHDEGRNEVIRWGWSSADALIAIAYKSPSEVAELVHAARAEERERCAQIAENLPTNVQTKNTIGYVFTRTQKGIAAAIRLTDTPEADQ